MNKDKAQTTKTLMSETKQEVVEELTALIKE